MFHDLVPLAVLSIPIIAIYLKHQRRMAELDLVNRPTAIETEQSAAQSRRIRELEDRVRVLERIVTDGRQATSIAAEIEALRD